MADTASYGPVLKTNYINPKGNAMAYIGFKNLESKLAAGGAKNPGAVAAVIGRKKYGSKKFNKAAAKGVKMKGMAPKGK